MLLQADVGDFGLFSCVLTTFGAFSKSFPYGRKSTCLLHGLHENERF